MTEKVRVSKTTLKAIAVLEKLNALGEARNSELADALELPRPTCYRLLQTLCVAGVVLNDPNSNMYRPAERALALSCGFEQETWVSVCAKPHMRKLGAELRWPIAIATLSGPSMVLRETTDPESPLVVRRSLAGRRVGLLSTATGRVYLAHCSGEQRNMLIQILQKSRNPDDFRARNTSGVSQQLMKIRELGFDTSRVQHHAIKWGAIAVPVFARGQILASLSVRFVRKAVTRSSERQQVLPMLRETAQRIGLSFEASSADVPGQAVDG
ncbi:MAG: IclR family transcriptional regulator C-terminal domain-containing protein [Pseudomonadota bacterium]